MGKWKRKPNGKMTEWNAWLTREGNDEGTDIRENGGYEKRRMIKNKHEKTEEKTAKGSERRNPRLKRMKKMSEMDAMEKDEGKI